MSAAEAGSDETAPATQSNGGDTVRALTARARVVASAQYASPRPWVTRLRRTARPVLEAVNGRLVTAVLELAEAVDALDASHRAAAEDARSQTVELADEIAALRADASSLRQERDSLAVRLRAIQQKLADLAEGERPAEPELGTLVQPPSDNLLGFGDYVEFERRFRGSRAAIVERQESTLELIRPRLEHLSAPVLDVGCGRGEWLEVLRDANIPAYGVDSNPDMARAAHERGLDVCVADGIEHLGGVVAGSLGAVSAFHLAEHLPLGILARFLDNAYGALADGGVLLLETPDPTNLAVGAASFYLDPTHLRPLHPLFLQFLVEIHGFVDVEILRLHPAAPDLLVAAEPLGVEPVPHHRTLEELSQAVFGAQDYLVVARRPAPVSTDGPEDTPSETTVNSASA